MPFLIGSLLQRRRRAANGALLGVVAGYGQGFVTRRLVESGVGLLDVRLGDAAVVRAVCDGPPPPQAPADALGFTFDIPPNPGEDGLAAVRFYDPDTGRRIHLAGPARVPWRRVYGHVDCLRGRTVHGWAVDTAHPGLPAELEVCLDGRAVAWGLADRERSDIMIHGRALRAGFAIEIGRALACGGRLTVAVRGIRSVLPGERPAVVPVPGLFFERRPGLRLGGWLPPGEADGVRLLWPGGEWTDCRREFSVPGYLASGDVYSGVTAELPPAFRECLAGTRHARLEVVLSGRTVAEIAYDHRDEILEALRRFAVYGEEAPDGAAALANRLAGDMPGLLERAGEYRTEAAAWMVCLIEALTDAPSPEGGARLAAALLAHCGETFLPWGLLHPLGTLLSRLSDTACEAIFAAVPEDRGAGGAMPEPARAASLLLRIRRHGLDAAAQAVADWLLLTGHPVTVVTAMLNACAQLETGEAFRQFSRRVFSEMAESGPGRGAM